MTLSAQTQDRYMIPGDFIDVNDVTQPHIFSAIIDRIVAIRGMGTITLTGNWRPLDGGFLILSKGETLRWQAERPHMGVEFTLEMLGIEPVEEKAPEPANEEYPEWAQPPFSHIDDYMPTLNPTPLPDVAGDVRVLVDFIIPTLTPEQLQALARDAIYDSPERLEAL